MPLSWREEQELNRMARQLEQDDPRLARKLGRPRGGPSSRPDTAHGLICIAAIAFGLGLAAVGAAWESPMCAAFGVAFAACAPIFISVWWNTRPHHRGPHRG
jgi:hypothetical protein